MNNLTVRILTAVVAGGASVAALILTHWGVFIFCALIGILGLIEFYKITGMRNWAVGLLAGGASLMIWIWVMQNHGPEIEGFKKTDPILTYMLAAFPLSAVALLFFPADKQPLKTLALAWVGLFYVTLPMALLHQASVHHPWAPAPTTVDGFRYNFHVVLGILFLIWTLDSMAYFGGRFLGKHKLWERHSPKKTWEGSLIGAAACMGLAAVLEMTWPVNGWSWWVAGAVASVLGQLGDLVESMFKRSLDLKDSGGLLPGHGGILDRFDGLLISMPLIFVMEGIVANLSK